MFAIIDIAALKDVPIIVQLGFLLIAAGTLFRGLSAFSRNLKEWHALFGTILGAYKESRKATRPAKGPSRSAKKQSAVSAAKTPLEDSDVEADRSPKFGCPEFPAK